MTISLGFSSYNDGRFELIVQDKDTGDETTLHGKLLPGQFQQIDNILPTCVFVEASFSDDNTIHRDFNNIDSAPENHRVVIYGNMPDTGKYPNNGQEEMAIGWKDRIDKKWYFAPQGGLVPFIPTKWTYVPKPPNQ